MEYSISFNRWFEVSVGGLKLKGYSESGDLLIEEVVDKIWRWKKKEKKDDPY